MKVAASFSIEHRSGIAFDAAFSDLCRKLEGTPALLFLHASAAYDAVEFRAELHKLGSRVKIHGGTSSQGVMTRLGFHSHEGFGLGMLGILDEEGEYRTGACLVRNDPLEAASSALLQALREANRPGEVPAMIMMTASPGQEELVLRGIEQVVGTDIPIFGGSAADNSVAGQWRQFAHDRVFDNAVVVSVLFPSTDVLFSFSSGYEPTDKQGQVTRAAGRTLLEIDGRPAAEVYNRWTDNLIGKALKSGGNILATTTFNPLGRKVGRFGEIAYFRLSHPESVTGDGALTLFTTFAEGEDITLMTGTEDSLVRTVWSAEPEPWYDLQWKPIPLPGKT